MKISRILKDILKISKQLEKQKKILNRKTKVYNYNLENLFENNLYKTKDKIEDIQIWLEIEIEKLENKRF